MAGPDNATIAGRLEALAGLLDLSGASYYSVRAYRRAAELIRSTPAPVADLVRQGRVRELRGIGDSIEARLRELVEGGVNPGGIAVLLRSARDASASAAALERVGLVAGSQRGRECRPGPLRVSHHRIPHFVRGSSR